MIMVLVLLLAIVVLGGALMIANCMISDNSSDEECVAALGVGLVVVLFMLGIMFFAFA